MRDKTPSPKAVVWDLNGTIIEGSDAVYNQATAWALGECGLTQFAERIPEDIVSRLRGGTLEDVWKYFYEHYGLAKSFEYFDAKASEGLQVAALQAFAAGTLRIRSHVEAAMKAIKKKNDEKNHDEDKIRQLIATNATPEAVALFKRILGLTEERLTQLGNRGCCLSDGCSASKTLSGHLSLRGKREAQASSFRVRGG
jgi:FMN phosphatase YigB (HAD superfamily)